MRKLEEGFDFGDAIKKVSEMFSGEEGKKQLAELMDLFRDDDCNENEKQKTPCEENNGFNIDPEMLFKIQKIMCAMNNPKTNEKTKLLLSLKPFLKGKRREKVDTAIKLLSLSGVMEGLKNE